MTTTPCACGGTHAWREHGHDDPQGLAPVPTASTEWAAKPAFAGTESHPLERTVEKKTAFHTRWFAEDTQKDLIVLHYTEGEGNWSPGPTWSRCNTDWWLAAKPEDQAQPCFTKGVGATAFGVTSNGQVEQFFPPECWSHSSSAGTTVHKRLIGIELYNLGWIMEMRNPAGQLVGYRSRCRRYGKTLPSWLEADLVPADAIPDENRPSMAPFFETVPWDVGGEPLRHQIKYWHAFPEAQITALIDLVDALCDRFGIPRAALPESERMSLKWPYGRGCTFRGVVSHMNFVQEGEAGKARPKWDVGPAFPWRKLLGGIGAPLGNRTMFRVRAEWGDAYLGWSELEEEAPSQTVQLLEQRLTFLGFNCGAADGIRDSHTRRGIRAFQDAEGDTVDGRVTAALCKKVLQRYNDAVRRRFAGC